MMNACMHCTVSLYLKSVNYFTPSLLHYSYCCFWDVLFIRPYKISQNNCNNHHFVCGFSVNYHTSVVLCIILTPNICCVTHTHLFPGKVTLLLCNSSANSSNVVRIPVCSSPLPRGAGQPPRVCVC